MYPEAVSHALAWHEPPAEMELQSAMYPEGIDTDVQVLVQPTAPNVPVVRHTIVGLWVKVKPGAQVTVLHSSYTAMVVPHVVVTYPAGAVETSQLIGASLQPVAVSTPVVEHASVGLLRMV